MRILMTGSSGFIGKSLTPILEKDHELLHLKSDLLDFTAVTDEVLSVSPDILVHLAARTEVEKSFYEQVSFSQVNYVGTVNLIQAASRIKNLKNFVFASTMEVYGWQPISDEVKEKGVPSNPIAFNEHTVPNPNAPYAVAKLGCEKYLEYAHRSLGFPFTAIRQTNSYGRKDNDFFVTEQIISQMIKNPNKIYLGYSEPYRNFIFIDDLINLWNEIINNPYKVNSGHIVTIGPNNPIRISDYANKIAKKLSWSGDIVWNSRPKRPGEIYWLNSDHDLITHLTGWKPVVSIERGLDLTIEMWREKLK